MLGGTTIQRRRRISAFGFSQAVTATTSISSASLLRWAFWKNKCLGSLVRLGRPMLRISIDESEEAVVLRLEGQLIGPWVQDVEHCWRKTFTTLGSRTVQVDLSAVNFVDASGGALLVRMHEAGFRLAGESPAIGHLLDQVQDEGIWGKN